MPTCSGMTYNIVKIIALRLRNDTTNMLLNASRRLTCYTRRITKGTKTWLQ
jgi:hypothetical protein